jgi:hypothetical protein
MRAANPCKHFNHLRRSRREENDHRRNR